MTPDAPSGDTYGDEVDPSWICKDIHVKVGQNNEAPERVGQEGYVISSDPVSNRVNVSINGEVVTLGPGSLRPVMPLTGQRVKIVSGDNAGIMGTLISVEEVNADGVVQTDDDEIRLLPVRHLCKLAEHLQ